MKLQPSDQLTNAQVKTGLHLILKDSLATETINTLTAGTFLVAIALYMGASNVQISAWRHFPASPIFSSLFQYGWCKSLTTVAVTAINAIAARVPLLLIGILPCGPP